MSARSWIFTNNNPEEPDSWKDDSRIRYVIFQLERSESNTYHWQGYVEFNTTMRLSGCKTILPKAHWEPRRGTPDQAADYASKESTRIAGPWTKGERVTQGKRVDISEFRDAIIAGASNMDLFKEHPNEMAKFPRFADNLRREIVSAGASKVTIENPSVWQTAALKLLAEPTHIRKVHWFYDPRGNSGKTYLSKHILSNFSAYYTNGGKFADITYAYKGQPIVIFDYPRSAEEFVSYAAIEAFKNGLISITKYESHTFCFEVPKVLVFANFEPDRSKLSEDRWDMHTIFNSI